MMKTSGQIAGFLALLFCFASTAPAANGAADGSIKLSLVKIYNVESSADYDLAWNMLSPREYTGSGSIIEGKRILTNAHVVSDSTYLEVRPYGAAASYRATIAAVSHEADLAILTVDDESFWRGRPALRLGELPEVLQEVNVYGFPAGGDSLSLTKGVISRVEVNYYAHSGIDMLLVQIDAAVNSGNSGGPAIIGGRIAGVVSQRYDHLQNVNYMVPPPVIRHFLEDVADGRYDGFPELGLNWQTLENESHRTLCGLPGDKTGILVVKVIPGSPASGIIEDGDIITAIDGHDVACDGSVDLRLGERVSWVHYVRLQQIGEKMGIEVFRDGSVLPVTVELAQAWDFQFLSPHTKYDRSPSYLMIGGMVFTPLNENFLATWGSNWSSDAPAHLLALNDEFKKERCEEAIILSKVLAHDLNRGFAGYENVRVLSLNGKKLLNMRDLARRIEEERNAPFLVFNEKNGGRIVIGSREAAAAQKEIMEIYGIPADRSEDLVGMDALEVAACP